MYIALERSIQQSRLRNLKDRLIELEHKPDKDIDDHKDMAELIGRINELVPFIAFIDFVLGQQHAGV